MKKVFSVPGFSFGGIHCGLKKNEKPDLAVILSDVEATVAGMFTQSKVKAAPVLLDIRRVKTGRARGILVNSGNANACTGKDGVKAAALMASLAERQFGLKKGEMLVSSTGVIGVPLPIEKIEEGLPKLVRSLSYNGLPGAARAIMTTDAYPKTVCITKRINGKTITVAGIAKGAGMICPNMATMLAYFVTDAKISPANLRRVLKASVEKSFNSISVDNDTSTNDTVIVMANGKSGADANGKDGLRIFAGLLDEAALKLAHMIVKDGEGATRFVEIDLRGAATKDEARQGAKTIADSMLVKTAFFGADPNWGRIIAALGRSGIRLKEERVDIILNGVCVAKGGLDTGKEKEAARALKSKNVVMEISLGIGKCNARFWTTDLGHEYVRINSAYRT